MGRRKVLVIVAALIAALGTGMVFLYVKGADTRADQKFQAATVMVATQAIAPGESLSAAKEAGKISSKTVTSGSLVPGSVSDLASIPKNDVALTTIYPGEQILQSKFGETGAGASTLGITKTQVAISVNLDDPARVAGFVNPGDHVTIFTTGASKSTANATRVLLQDVPVIGVGSTTTVSRTTTDESGAQTTESIPRTIMTLTVDQTDAQKVLQAYKGQPAQVLSFALRNDDSSVDRAYRPTDLQNLFD